MSKTIIVAALDIGPAYSRGVMRGLQRYAKLRTDWSVVHAGAVADPVVPRSSRAAVLAQAISPGASRRLAALSVPVVNVGDATGDHPVPTVVTDHHAVGRLAAEHFLVRGFRNLLFLGPPEAWYARQRRAGFVDRLIEAGCPPLEMSEAWPDPFDPHRDHGAWLRPLPRPLAVFACNDAVAGAVADIALDARLRVPEDIAVLGVDNDELICDASRVPLSSVAVAAERIGFEAARFLDQQLAGGRVEPGIAMRVPPLGVIDRHSTDVIAIEDPLVAEAVGFMRDQLGRPLTVETVVEHLRVSRRQLEQHFKAALHRAPASELRRLRIWRAMDLMDNTDLPLADIAARAGFGDASVLSQTFRREMGTTPSAYRNRARLS